MFVYIKIQANLQPTPIYVTATGLGPVSTNIFNTVCTDIFITFFYAKGCWRGHKFQVKVLFISKNFMESFLIFIYFVPFCTKVYPTNFFKFLSFFWNLDLALLFTFSALWKVTFIHTRSCAFFYNLHVTFNSQKFSQLKYLVLRSLENSWVYIFLILWWDSGVFYIVHHSFIPSVYIHLIYWKKKYDIN